MLQPIDYEISSEFDVTSPRVQQAIAESLPKVHVVSCALDCSTKSRIREIPLPGPQPAPKPLRTLAHPRGVPGLPQHLHDRVRRDNLCADFLLAVQYLMVDKGRGAFRENPRNSLHWVDPCEEFLCASHQWFDWKYDACCLFATRRKKQLIRSSLDTFASLPDLVCGHVHSATEWQPQILEDGSRWFPSKEEAEYTAHLCFVLVVACSHWAAQRGFAVLRIQRMPPMQTTGDWRHLMHLDPRVFREWALPAVAAFLGLSISADGPIRVQASDVWTKQDGLAPDAIYIGHGHFSHRLAATDWECPFRVGRDGSPHEVVLQYLQHLNEHVTADQIASLAHLRLACDCPPAEFCHGDALVGTTIASIHRRFDHLELGVLVAYFSVLWLDFESQVLCRSRSPKRALFAQLRICSLLSVGTAVDGHSLRTLPIANPSGPLHNGASSNLFSSMEKLVPKFSLGLALSPSEQVSMSNQEPQPIVRRCPRWSPLELTQMVIFAVPWTCNIMALPLSRQAPWTLTSSSQPIAWPLALLLSKLPVGRLSECWKSCLFVSSQSPISFATNSQLTSKRRTGEFT